MARSSQVPRATRRLNMLNMLGDLRQYRIAQQRLVAAGQPTFTRALYLANQRAALAAKQQEAAKAQAVRLQQARLEVEAV